MKRSQHIPAVALWFFTEYGQFYICDPDSDGLNRVQDFWTKEAFERSLAVSKGIIGVGVLEFGLVRGLFQVFPSAPNIPSEAWDNIVEGSITSRKGRLDVLNCTDTTVQHRWKLSPGDYRVRVYSALFHLTAGDCKRINENLEAMGESGPDFYWVCVWPAPFDEPKHIKGPKRKSA